MGAPLFPTGGDAARAPDILCIGETMAVVTADGDSSLVDGREFTIGCGGAESNVAGHLAADGLAVAWLGRLGADPLGDRIVAAFDGNGIDSRWVVRDPLSQTGVYFKDRLPGAESEVYYYRSSSAASRMSPADLAAWPLHAGCWVHVSGVTAALSADCDAVLEQVLDGAAQHGYTVSFDVNYRPKLWDTAWAAPRLLELARRADTVFVGRDEAELLWGTARADEIASLFPDATRVVVKDGAVEAVEFGSEGGIDSGIRSVHRVPAREVSVVEAVGAGDAFAAGYLSALFRGEEPRARLERGHELAAWVLGSRADFRPLERQGGGAR